MWARGLARANDFQPPEIDEATANEAELFRLASAGELRPHVAGSFALSQAADALRQLVDGGVTGKLVLVR